MSERARRIIFAIILLAMLCCDGDTPGGPDPVEVGTEGSTRSFALGFTDFPHARSVAAVLEAFNTIERDADLAVMHFDDGVPWQEALARAPYAEEYRDSLDLKSNFIPERHLVYLAVTPLNFERNGLARHRGASGNEPLAAPWNGRSLDHPEVIEAFLQHCERMIETFSPNFFAYAIEANMLFETSPEQWRNFVRFSRAIYPELKANWPDLPVFITLQADFFHRDRGDQTGAIRRVLAFTDYVAVSTYPFTDEPDPRSLRGGHFTAMAALSPSKPFAIAETAWPAEDVTDPVPVFIPGSEENQRLYVDRLLADADRLSAVFVTWFFTRDYDALWTSDIQFLDDAPLLRLWKDTGLYDGDGNPRPALAVWRDWLERPLR